MKTINMRRNLSTRTEQARRGLLMFTFGLLLQLAAYIASLVLGASAHTWWFWCITAGLLFEIAVWSRMLRALLSRRSARMRQQP
jgi:hypothetical protein